MKKSTISIRRGEVYLVNLDPTIGHEIRKKRPALVISNSFFNAVSPTITVIPITTGAFSYIHCVPLIPPEGGVTKNSTIVCDQIRTVDQRRLVRTIGIVSAGTLIHAEKEIRNHLGLIDSQLLNEEDMRDL